MIRFAGLLHERCPTTDKALLLKNEFITSRNAMLSSSSIANYTMIKIKKFRHFITYLRYCSQFCHTNALAGCKVCEKKQKKNHTYTQLNSFTQYSCKVRHYQSWHAPLSITTVILWTTGNSKVSTSPSYPTLVNLTTALIIKVSAWKGQCWHRVI